MCGLALCAAQVLLAWRMSAVQQLKLGVNQANRKQHSLDAIYTSAQTCAQAGATSKHHVCRLIC
eukprot:3518758-Amphidinium_carterae.2